MAFEFNCSSCGEIHRGMPSFGATAPHSYYEVVESERAQRCVLGDDDCVIDGEFFFIRGCIEIPVHGESEPFVWGVWISLSEASFKSWADCFGAEKRAHVGPFFGWLNTRLRPYSETVDLKTQVFLRDDGVRLSVHLEPTDHPLAKEQRDGISVERVAEMYGLIMHADATRVSR